jgi:hypothetical protein
MTGPDTAAPTLPPKRQAPALAVLFAVVFINLVGFGLVVPLLPFFGQSLKAEAWQVALMFSAYSLGQFFAEPFWGRLSDRIGRKPVLLITVLCQRDRLSGPRLRTQHLAGDRGAAFHRPGRGQYLDRSRAMSPTSPRRRSAPDGWG